MTRLGEFGKAFLCFIPIGRLSNLMDNIDVKNWVAKLKWPPSKPAIFVA